MTSREVILEIDDRSKAVATPGPWEAVAERDDSNMHSSIYGAGYKGLLIARCNQNGAHDADARLIAAAPELIEALKDAMALLESLKRGGGLVSVPIATWGSQARSETKSFWCVPTWNLSDAEDVIEAAEVAIKKATGE